MGRNFPSTRAWLDELRDDFKRVKRVIRDSNVANSLDEILDFLHSEAGAVSVSKNPILMQLFLLIGKLMAMINDRGDNNRC